MAECLPDLHIGERVVELGQIEGPLGLTMVQRLGRSEICDVSVVVQDLNHVFIPL